MASVGGGSKDQLELNLYPMLDIFSILITFLLMSYSTDPVSHDVKAGIELPESATMVALDEIPAISVSKTEVVVNDKVVARLVDGDVPEAERGESSQGAIRPVFDELKKVAEANKRLGAARMDDPGVIGKTGQLTMEMDKQHRFKLMKRIMLSAQQAEFVTFKLIVTRSTN
jgi:biopolymer transport protein ExbD